ncbi:hypothetical protein GQ44DRAFT_803146 [Phaeosphaeriaceae sp. PMI808]|nr:hypothetical protein GQ44DRAFT_803146 [Phaeosphaeriaceae sp. PMI808]
MFNIFSQVAKPFKPILAPLPPREPCGLTCNNQEQSPFFSKLPAEIRNEIYNYAFESEVRELLSIEAHPLSLLLTCHKANHEASILAFSLITNALLIFPSLSHFELRILRGEVGFQELHHNNTPPMGRERVIHTYIPYWFTSFILQPITNGYAHAWQAGEHWNVETPDLKNGVNLDDDDSEDNSLFKTSKSIYINRKVRGVHLCPCKCGNVQWLSADLVQQTGRRLRIDTTYYGPEERPLPELSDNELLRAKLGPNVVILEENEAPLGETAGSNTGISLGVTSVEYKADEEYWESMRRRNGDLSAIFRQMWRVVRGGHKEVPQGSMARGVGDWARMGGGRRAV